MNNEKTYWKWKNTIIDFNNISDEKADFGDYWTKKEMIFHYLGTPDDEIHEWYNGGWSTEYNYALSYAKELGLVENYIDYDDELFEKQQQLDKYKNVIDKIKEYCNKQIEIAKENISNSEQWLKVEECHLSAKQDIHTGKLIKRENEKILELLEEVE